VITKLDLAEAVACDLPVIRHNIQAVRLGMEIFEVSAKTGEGMEQLQQYLVSRTVRAQASQAV
jgi:hydrogenase nickel incorporation protein HypB